MKNCFLLLFVMMLASACSSNRYGCKGKRCVQVDAAAKDKIYAASVGERLSQNAI